MNSQRNTARHFSGKDPWEESTHLDPECDICPAFDSTGMRKDHIPSRKKTGPDVLDNCCEEHMM